MTPPAGASNPREVVAGSVRTLAAQRIGRAFLPLLIGAVLGAVGFATGALTGSVALGAFVGAPAVAGAFLVMGQRAVRRAAGLPASGLWALADFAWVAPWAWGFGLLVLGAILPGRIALQGQEWVHLALHLGVGLVAVRVLRDGVRVGELSTLADVMVVPSAEEGRPWDES